MHIAVVSDTHMPRGARALPEGCVERLRSADLILHAGDFTGAAFLEWLRGLGPPVEAVVGNIDEPAEVERVGGIWILNPGSPTERRRAPEKTMIELVDSAPTLVSLGT